MILNEFRRKKRWNQRSYGGDINFAKWSADNYKRDNNLILWLWSSHVET
jgi:hypothetical protein